MSEHDDDERPTVEEIHEANVAMEAQGLVRRKPLAQ
jgi:hypothetical protein